MSFWCRFTIPSSQDIVMIAHIANRFKMKNPQNAWIAQSEIVIFNFLLFVIICRNSTRIYTIHYTHVQTKMKNVEKAMMILIYAVVDFCWSLFSLLPKHFHFLLFFSLIIYIWHLFYTQSLNCIRKNSKMISHTSIYVYFLSYKIKSHHKINISSY